MQSVIDARGRTCVLRHECLHQIWKEKRIVSPRSRKQGQGDRVHDFPTIDGRQGSASDISDKHIIGNVVAFARE